MCLLSGLLDIYRQLNLPNLEIPERKINVLLVGNHSSGKSTFINWYVSYRELAQRTFVHTNYKAYFE